jgi:hypothetical protein
MSQNVSLNDFSKEDKILLLKELGFDSDGEFVLNDKKEKVFDKYLDIPVKFDNMLILSGSTIILDDNEYSLMRYMQEYESLE